MGGNLRRAFGRVGGFCERRFSFSATFLAEFRTMIIRTDFGFFQFWLTSTHERRETDDHLYADG
jgi:hypothetical protein